MGSCLQEKQTQEKQDLGARLGIPHPHHIRFLGMSTLMVMKGFWSGSCLVWYSVRKAQSGDGLPDVNSLCQT